MTLSARSGSLGPVQMVADAHVSTPNALFDVPGADGRPDAERAAEHGAVRIRRAPCDASGQAVTVPLVITDGCGGQWSTLVGGGPTVFSGPGGDGAAVAVERLGIAASTPTPTRAASISTPTRTPTRVATGR